MQDAAGLLSLQKAGLTEVRNLELSFRIALHKSCADDVLLLINGSEDAITKHYIDNTEGPAEVLPQAVKNILPAVGNEFVAIIKETSMASTFFVGDLMTSYLKVRGATYLALESLIIIGIIYLIVTFTLSKLIGKYERKLNSK